MLNVLSWLASKSRRVLLPLMQGGMNEFEIARRPHDFLISWNGSHPLAQSDVAFLCEIKSRQSHKRRSVHAGSGNTDLAHQIVSACQLLKQLQLGSAHVRPLEERLFPAKGQVYSPCRNKVRGNSIAEKDGSEPGMQYQFKKLPQLIETGIALGIVVTSSYPKQHLLL